MRRGSWGSTAAGKFDVQSGTLQLDGSFKTADLNIGTGFTRSGGAVTITGTLDNTGDTLALDASTGAFNLSSANGAGLVRGGLITGVGSNALGILASQQGTLDGHRAARITGDNRAGLIVAPGDLEGFLDAAARLHDSESLRSELGVNARAYAEATFPIAKTAALFDRILAS